MSWNDLIDRARPLGRPAPDRPVGWQAVGLTVEGLMTRDPLTIGPAALLTDALDLMDRNSIHELPVARADGTLVGIISERDLRARLGPDLHEDGVESLPDEVLESLVEDHMTPDPFVVHAAAGAGAATRLLLEHRIGSLPVVGDAGELVGILSITDVLAEAAVMFDRAERP